MHAVAVMFRLFKHALTHEVPLSIEVKTFSMPENINTWNMFCNALCFTKCLCLSNGKKHADMLVRDRRLILNALVEFSRDMSNIMR